ncbi:porin [Shinella sp. SUS2]|uniref:porin n=1 Tax=unclassified Shinella TaxID=2643062 RepID=UPI0012E197A9
MIEKSVRALPKPAYAIWGGISASVTEKLTLNTQLSYDEAENFAAVANVNFNVVPGFTVTPEVMYMSNFDQGGSDKWGGMLRFQRSF